MLIIPSYISFQIVFYSIINIQLHRHVYICFFQNRIIARAEIDVEYQCIIIPHCWIMKSAAINIPIYIIFTSVLLDIIIRNRIIAYFKYC